MEEKRNNLQKLMSILKNNNVFLTGGGGVGKSYLCNEVIKEYRSNKRQVVVLGSTGISAVHVGGQTLHSFFAFGIANDEEQMQINDKKIGRKLRELNTILSSCDLIVIDEISMVSSNLLDMIRYRLQNGNFKGRLLFVGDFFQLPPVNKNTQNTIFGNSLYAFESLAWEYFEPKIVVLDKPKRTSDKEFFSILNGIRIGKLDASVIDYLESLRENYEVWDDNPTILFGRNREVNILNSKKLSQIQSELIVFPALEVVHEKNLHIKRLESWKKALGVDENLELKVGANVLFTANKKGSYYNGERGVIVGIDDDSIDVQKDNLKIVNVKRHEYCLNELVSLEDKIQDLNLASIEQFPLKLSYAITIHKSQGMSLEKMVCNIDNIFEKSQFYVALSRAIDPNSLFLYYSRNDFLDQIKRSVEVDERVEQFYQKSDCIYIER
ncbi:MAG: PIF1 helicase [Proteobacteria bacterium]|nr:MAG: PIF1 helicase [Pseudomonadota bacterium]